MVSASVINICFYIPMSLGIGYFCLSNYSQRNNENVESEQTDTNTQDVNIEKGENKENDKQKN